MIGSALRRAVTRARHATASAQARVWFAGPWLPPGARVAAVKGLGRVVSNLESVELALWGLS